MMTPPHPAVVEIAALDSGLLLVVIRLFMCLFNNPIN